MPTRRKPKVGFVLPMLSSGGAERATASIASALDPGRYEPVILLQSEGPRLYEPAPHVRVVEVGAGRTHEALLPITRVLRAERPDLIYGLLPHLNLIAAAATRTMRAPRPKLVLSIHNNLGAELPQWSNGALLTRLTPWAYRQADAIVAVSRGAGDQAVRDFGADPAIVRAIANPIEVEAIRAAAEGARPAHRWLDDDALTVAVAMGRLVPQKNYPLLLDAFARVAADDPAARLLILGDGPLRGQLEMQLAALGLSDRVEFTGVQSEPFGYLAQADVFVSSSDFEGLPLAHLEALTIGTPVVSTDCDFGPGEILGGGRYGVLTPVGSAEALADALGALLRDPERRRALRAAGPPRADEYRTERVAPQYEALFAELLGSA